MAMFQKATKQRRRLRAAVFGPSGAGKTYSSVAIASGMGSRVAVIDTERGSASLYSDRFSFDVCDLADRTINGYCQVIQGAANAGYDVLVIDSLSHAWQELLQEVDRIANAKYRGNTWSAWNEGTPKQRRLVDAILDFPGHVIATMRSKTEWTTEKDSRGKDRPVRVGLAPEQGKGIEYEFDLLLELSVDHTVNVIKDRTGKFQDRIMDKPGPEFGKELLGWLSDGAEPRVATVAPAPAPELDRDELQRQALRRLTDQGLSTAGIKAMLAQFEVKAWGQLPDKTLATLAKLGAKPETIERWNGEGTGIVTSAAHEFNTGDKVTIAGETRTVQRTVQRIDPAPPAVEPETVEHEDADLMDDDEPMLWAGGDE